MQTQEKRIVMLDASALKHLACGLDFYRTIIEGWRGSIPMVDTFYGSCFHAFIAEMNTIGEGNGGYAQAITKAVTMFETTPKIEKKSKSWMTAQHLAKTCMDYWEFYNGTGKKNAWQTLEVVGKGKMIELKFATLPYYSDDTVDIILSGTIDDICKNDSGCYAIRDYKTTSRWDMDLMLNEYQLSSQLKFYTFIVYWYARQYPDSIYADIVKSGRIGAFIDVVFLKSGATASSITTFRRSEVFFFSPRVMDEFKDMLDTIAIPKILAMLKAGKPPHKEGSLNGACAKPHGQCSFFGSCCSPDEISAQHILKNEFIQKPYDPLNFHS